jgi:hypothetical protein
LYNTLAVSVSLNTGLIHKRILGQQIGDGRKPLEFTMMMMMIKFVEEEGYKHNG